MRSGRSVPCTPTKPPFGQSLSFADRCRRRPARRSDCDSARACYECRTAPAVWASAAARRPHAPGTRGGRLPSAWRWRRAGSRRGAFEPAGSRPARRAAASRSCRSEGREGAPPPTPADCGVRRRRPTHDAPDPSGVAGLHRDDPRRRGEGVGAHVRPLAVVVRRVRGPRGRRLRSQKPAGRRSCPRSRTAARPRRARSRSGGGRPRLSRRRVPRRRPGGRASPRPRDPLPRTPA
jgi:hypothetical protein